MIQFSNYSFAYAGNSENVIKNISMKIEEGSFTLLCGASGCGKTTLLLQLKKKLTPVGEHKGELRIHGKRMDEISDLEAAATIGYVGQDPDRMIITDKVWHELAFGLESLMVSQDKMKKQVAQIAQFFGLQDSYLCDTANLSGGQKQLVALASVMAMQPKVLILDEPTSQLDPLAASEFIHTLKRINEELGTTIILCEHRLEEVFPLSDQVILMSQGEIEKMGSKEEVLEYLSSKGKSARFYEGLPAYVRIYGELEKNREFPCPVTMKQGRIWYTEYCNRKQLNQIEKIVRTEYAGEELLRLEELYVAYKDEVEPVLKSASLTIHEGEWFCLMGGNGAGKSTLLKALCGQISYEQGSIYYEQKKVTNKHCIPVGKQGMVYLPQNPNVLFGQITVEEELLAMLEKPYEMDKELSSTEKETIIEAMLEKMELSHVRGHHPYDLSGGQQQRLALAKLFMLQPKLILLDEPTKGMDPGFKPEFAKMIREFKEQGGSVLMVSHDVEFVAEYGDSCGLLFDGEVIATQNAREFFVGNSFYTTSTNKMVRSNFDSAVTVTEVVKACTMD